MSRRKQLSCVQVVRVQASRSGAGTLQDSPQIGLHSINRWNSLLLPSTTMTSVDSVCKRHSNASNPNQKKYLFLENHLEPKGYLECRIGNCDLLSIRQQLIQFLRKIRSGLLFQRRGGLVVQGLFTRRNGRLFQLTEGN